ncbi:hypothetical protein Syun_003043 [Stephania yunnanensis]|uniref:Uncharacterized protein n=1 Tax=Stephania yunnanensis TaxID=152371 RepID=A0AAP0L0K9_9MAGN
MGAGTAERFAFYGASSNLMTSLTGPLGQSTAAASENINAWTGAACMLPLFGGIIADSGLSRYNTILASSILYVMNFQIPAASLQAFTTLSVSLCMPIYDCIFVPITRALTGRPSGVTALQRVGYGMSISVISMIVAALIERKRLETAINYGLVDMPDEVIPMTVWWLLPQYIIMGVSRAFTMVGLQEFFYDQVPNGMRSLGIALYMSVFGVGSFLSGVLISIIEKVTNAYGTQSWFPNNLNKGHLDYFLASRRT